MELQLRTVKEVFVALVYFPSIGMQYLMVPSLQAPRQNVHFLQFQWRLQLTIFNTLLLTNNYIRQ